MARSRRAWRRARQRAREGDPSFARALTLLRSPKCRRSAQIPCILYLDSLNGSEKAALNRSATTCSRRVPRHDSRAPETKMVGAPMPGLRRREQRGEDLDADEGAVGAARRGEDVRRPPTCSTPKRTACASRTLLSAIVADPDRAALRAADAGGGRAKFALLADGERHGRRVPAQPYDCGVYMPSSSTRRRTTLRPYRKRHRRDERGPQRARRARQPSRFFTCAGEKIDGRMIDGLRVSNPRDDREQRLPPESGQEADVPSRSALSGPADKRAASEAGEPS